jgi:uncharacterized protein
MKLTNDVELLDGLPIAYIRSIEAIVLSDLHLGYEGLMAKKGALFPKVNLKKIIEMTGKALDQTGAKSIIVNGDIKNEFAKVDLEEFNELYDFILFTRERKKELILIKGNHDNFVERYKEPFGLKVYPEQALIGDYFFFHGEVLPKDVPKNKMMVMGHEHPAISIVSGTGKRERLRCFLLGKYGKTPLLVLPAVGYFSSGNEVNSPNSDMLSPVFDKVDIGSMKAIACEYGSTLDFGKVKELRKVAF